MGDLESAAAHLDSAAQKVNDTAGFFHSALDVYSNVQGEIQAAGGQLAANLIQKVAALSQQTEDLQRQAVHIAGELIAAANSVRAASF